MRTLIYPSVSAAGSDERLYLWYTPIVRKAAEKRHMHTHTSSIDWERLMKRLTPTFFALVLLTSIVPVYAQTATPSAPSGDAVARAADALTDSVERIGINAFVPAVVSLIALVIVLVLLLVVYRYGAKPFLDNTQAERVARQEERQERLEAQRELSALRERQAAAEERRIAAQERQAELEEKMVARLKELEPADEAKQGRKDAVTEIDTHIDGAIKPVKEAAEKMVTTISEIEKQLQDMASTVVTKEEFGKAIGVVQESMEKLRIVVETTLLTETPLPAPSAEANKEGED